MPSLVRIWGLNQSVSPPQQEEIGRVIWDGREVRTEPDAYFMQIVREARIEDPESDRTLTIADGEAWMAVLCTYFTSLYWTATELEREGQPVAMAVGDAAPSSSAGIVADGEVLPKKVEVWRDWDALRAVMVGVPDHDVLPAWYPDWTDPDGNEVAGPETAGMTKAEYDSERFAGAVRQMDALAELLEREGVQVYRSPPTSLEVAKAPSVGLTAQWPREELTVVGNRVIVNQMRVPHRNKEIQALEPFLARLRMIGIQDLRLPPVSPERDDNWEADPRPFLEGGDIFRLGKDVLVTMSYLTTSPTGFRWLADQLEPLGIEVWPAYLTHDWFHGDYILLLVREGLCLAYPGGFRDGILPAPITDWTVVEMTAEEADSLQGNGFVLRENVVLLPAGAKRINRSLQRKGVEVIEVPFGDVTFWQGGLDCATTELWREGKQPWGVMDA